jgi:hypothetical protein
VEDIFKVVEQECRRVESRSLQEKPLPDESVVSILVFRRFINAVMLGVRLTHCTLPSEHMAAYRKCVVRLVGARRLPPEANDEFDKTFSADGRASRED